MGKASAKALRAACYLMSLGSERFSVNNVSADFPSKKGGTWHRRVFDYDEHGGVVIDDAFVTGRAIIALAKLTGNVESFSGALRRTSAHFGRPLA